MLFRSDEITTQEQLDALNELLEAENARDQALTDLRNAVLDYLLATGQMRINRDGTFEPLPGMPDDPLVIDETDDMSFDCKRPAIEIEFEGLHEPADAPGAFDPAADDGQRAPGGQEGDSDEDDAAAGE